MTSPDLQLAVSGRVLRFPAIWLRDNCPCPECVAPGTTQKLNDITDLPNGVAVTRTEHAGDDDERTEDGKQLWLPAELESGRFPQANWSRYLDQPAERTRALEAVLRLGFVLRRATSPSPAVPSARTPTTRTAIRCRPCSCCTACAPRARGVTPGWWTASPPPRRSGPPTRNRSAP